ncbi:unnamed protein product [Bursaphelenchus okinawaensis]|uniref:Probable ATP-dependent RNA helicase spindle-E n=1 Tax=Bursaphelenchus okinawaensis TaxID=465554 RepID=A0A811JUU6_9BILA|nr:unnamed protein product [Bursaphelenchus okinawaensis]CAG9084992.1 unnamed protein product [Bursaphelenchus okinawaensis]
MRERNHWLKYIPAHHQARMGKRTRKDMFAGHEQFEEEMRTKLKEFRASDVQEVILQPMTRDERVIVHIVAKDYNLRTHSFGEEPNRRTRVTKAFFDRVVGLTDTQNLYLDADQKQTIKKLFVDKPLQIEELEEHQRADMKMRHNVNRSKTSTSSTEQAVAPPSQCTEQMRHFRRTLPTSQYRDDILNQIEANNVTIITGGTGCGKTTQVPQFLLEESNEKRKPIKIVCTQPRRLPAIAVAERVAKERNERLGDTVGYHIRLEQKTSNNTLLTYCTSGVLLRMLTVDDVAKDITHIILDEVHEREQNTDYLLIVLRQALKKRNDLKVILMSATMEGNRETFSNYFHNFTLSFIDIPSRLHSVQKFFLGDILALTGYQPQSIFGTGFGDNTFGNTFSISEFDYQKPQTSGFGSFNDYNDHLHRSTTVPSNLQAYHNTTGHHGYYDSTFFLTNQANNYNGYGHGNGYTYNNGWNGDYGTYQDHHGTTYHDSAAYPTVPTKNGFDSVQHHGTAQLKTFFDPNDTSRANVSNKEQLIESYLNNGGAQWTDAVDPDLTAEVIRFCLGSPLDGAILVFLPGYDDILTLRDKVKEFANTVFEPVIFTLHSQMNSQDQQKVFDPVRHGQKKVILSTNIAEASLTIDDVVFVIDCGKVKEKTYDHVSRISQLKVSWIARSNADQRSGRAGRCRNGYCFRLYSKRDFEMMSPTQVAEMKRVAIHDVCLHAKMFAPDKMPVRKFLELAPEPPVPGAIDRSLEFLEQLGAVSIADRLAASKYNQQKQKDPEPVLTELGRLVAHLPLDPQLARLLLFGVALKCVHPVLGLVAALSHRDPFVLPLGEDRGDALSARDKFCQTDMSDHLMLLRALNLYCQQPNTSRSIQTCRQNFMSFTAMKMIVGIRKQLFLEMRRLHLVPQDAASSEDPDLNLYSNSWPMVQGAIVAGCYPGVAFVRSGSKLRKIRTNTSNMATLHPSSSLKRQVQQQKRQVEPEIEYLVYQELSRIDEGLTLRTVTAVPPMTVAIFAGPVKMSKVIIDDFELAEHEFEEDEKVEDNTVSGEEEDKEEGEGNEEEKEGNEEGKVAKEGNKQAKEEEKELKKEKKMEQEEEYDPFTPSFGSPPSPSKFEREYYVELENWLGFKGHFTDLQLTLRLRFRFMNYFLNVLKNPTRPLSISQLEILRTVADVLEMDHKKAAFNTVDDIYTQKWYKKISPVNRMERKKPEDRSSPKTFQMDRPQTKPVQLERRDSKPVHIERNSNRIPLDRRDSRPGHFDRNEARPGHFDRNEARGSQNERYQGDRYQNDRRNENGSVQLERKDSRLGQFEKNDVRASQFEKNERLVQPDKRDPKPYQNGQNSLGKAKASQDVRLDYQNRSESSYNNMEKNRMDYQNRQESRLDQERRQESRSESDRRQESRFDNDRKQDDYYSRQENRLEYHFKQAQDQYKASSRVAQDQAASSKLLQDQASNSRPKEGQMSRLDQSRSSFNGKSAGSRSDYNHGIDHGDSRHLHQHTGPLQDQSRLWRDQQNQVRFPKDQDLSRLHKSQDQSRLYKGQDQSNPLKDQDQSCLSYQDQPRSSQTKPENLGLTVETKPEDPIPADPSPNNKDSERLPTKVPSNPSDLILAQLNKAQARSRNKEEMRKLEEKRLYRPPKSLQRQQEKQKAKEKEKNGVAKEVEAKEKVKEGNKDKQEEDERSRALFMQRNNTDSATTSYDVPTAVMRASHKSWRNSEKRPMPNDAPQRSQDERKDSNRRRFMDRPGYDSRPNHDNRQGYDNRPWNDQRQGYGIQPGNDNRQSYDRSNHGENGRNRRHDADSPDSEEHYIWRENWHELKRAKDGFHRHDQRQKHDQRPAKKSANDERALREKRPQRNERNH